MTGFRSTHCCLVSHRPQRTGFGAAASGTLLSLLPRRPWLIMCMRPRAPDAALDAACDRETVKHLYHPVMVKTCRGINNGY